MKIEAFIQQLKSSETFAPQITYHRYLPPQKPGYTKHSFISPEILLLLQYNHIDKLYSHQCDAIEKLKNSEDIIVSTPTASGKSLIYNVPVIESIFANPNTRALYLFPLKALEQDQLKNLYALISFPGQRQPTAAIYDGDTPAAERKKIKRKSPNIILTNPDMLHRGILPCHEQWSDFFSNLRFVVIDEVHSYRGIFGSHLAQILRRLKRICHLYGTAPQFILSSATIQNPHDLATKLTQKETEIISQNGAPKAGQHFLFLNPHSSATILATELFIQCLRSGLRTIAFTQSRKITELITVWIRKLAPYFTEKVSSYRAGFLPGERRSIEQKLATGDLLGVISTSALEMGIDIGYLDVCILVGYPGTIVNTWQRGGRVGRSGRESLVVLIANEDALDQYFMHHPDHFFEQSFEAAVIDPNNSHVIRAHLPCAAAELPLTLNDSEFWDADLDSHLGFLESTGELSRTIQGDPKWFSTQKRPHLRVNIRSIGDSYSIFSTDTGDAIGTIDGIRALKECHAGAIYLHRATSYVVEKLILDRKDIIVRETDANYFTRVRSEKETEVLKIIKTQPKGQFIVKLAELKVTEYISGYEKRRIPGQELMGVFPLDLPPQTFETIGLWIEIEDSIKIMTENKGCHFMGGIHAIEHAAISIFPLFALCDRNDIGGISYTFHPQVEKAAIFIYDAYPGGVGLAQRGYEIILALLHQAHDLIRECPCTEGCPSCIYSPKCGSGNKPLDKKAALLILEVLTGMKSLAEITFRPESSLSPAAKQKQKITAEKQKQKRIIYFDLETQRSAEEVGGWQNAHLMLVSVAVIYDSVQQTFHAFKENDIDKLFDYFWSADLIVGFNLKRFDYSVLAPYTPKNLQELPTFDLLEDIYTRIGFRLSLDHLARETLNTKKSGDGLQALRWFKDGEIEKLTEYCRQDVVLTRDLFLHGIEKGYLVYRTKREDEPVRLIVEWNPDKLINHIKK